MSLQPESGSESDSASTGEPVKASTKPNAPPVVLFISGVAVVCFAGLYFGVFSGQQVFQSANHVLYFEPLSRYIGEALRAERIPLWNPYCYSGMSQIANLTPSPFYPFTALFAVLDYNRAVALSLVVHELIALGGTYLLIRSGGYSKTAALAGGFVFVFCGCLAQGMANFTVAWTATWLPWCLWALLRLQRVTGRARLAGAVAVLSILFAMNMLAGCIELAILIAGMLKILAVLNAVKSAREGEEFFSSLLRQWSALVLGTLMAAPALLPAVEWAIDKFNYQFSVIGKTADPLITLMGFFTPVQQKYGSSLPGQVFLNGSPTGQLNVVDHVLPCFGPLVIAIAVFGLLSKSWTARGLVGITIVGTTAMCVVPLQSLDLPLARFLPSAFLCHPSAPFAVLLSFACALAVARGMLRIESGEIGFRLRLTIFAITAVPTIVPIILRAPVPNLMQTPVPGTNEQLLYIFPCALILFSFLVNVLPRFISPTFASDGRATLCCLVGSLFFLSLHPTMESLSQSGNTEYSALRKVSSKKEAGQERVAISPVRAISATDGKVIKPTSGVIQPTSDVIQSMSDVIQSTSGVELLAANRNIDLKVSNAFGYQATGVPSYNYLISRFGNSPPSEELGKFYRMTAVEPSARAYATTTWTWAETNQQAQDVVNSRAFFDNPLSAVVERNTAQGVDIEKLRQFPSGLMNPPASAPQKAPDTQVPPAQAKVELMQYEPEHVVLSVDLEQPSFVILKDTFYPGWHASVDVIPTACYRANGINRAVYVDKGAHLVQFDFKPDSYLIGLKCFVTALAVFFYLVIWSIARLIVKTIRFLSFGVWED